MNGLIDLLRRHLVSDAPPLTRGERWRSTIAGFLGLLLFEAVLFVLPLAPDEKRLLAPIGATSIIVFMLPHSPLAQPWSIIGGLMLSAPLGYACGHWLPEGPWVVAIALAASVWLTAWARCLHPPAGAMALTMAMAAAEGAAFAPGMLAAMANTIAIMVAVMVVNNLIPGRHYPQGTPPAAQLRREHRAPEAITHKDLEAALGEIEGFLDVREDDLVDLYQRTMRQAFERTHRLRCGDLIEHVTPVPAVEFATPLADAWRMMRRLRVDALPVIDRSRRVIGLLVLEDFLLQVSPADDRSVRDSLRHLLGRVQQAHSNKPEVVGQMMRDARNGLLVVRKNEGVAAIAEAMASGRQPAVPVINSADRLVGTLGRADLVAALYHRIALADAMQAG